MSEDEELRKLAEQDLEKLDLVLSDLIGDASRLLIPGRDFDSSNAQLEVHAGEISV
jgi:protein subunit release factor A